MKLQLITKTHATYATRKGRNLAIGKNCKDDYCNKIATHCKDLCDKRCKDTSKGRKRNILDPFVVTLAKKSPAIRSKGSALAESEVGPNNVVHSCNFVTSTKMSPTICL